MLQPLHIDVDRARIFCLYREATTSIPTLGSVIFLPAFAEEMNRTRSFVARAAFELSEAGFNVLHLDLSGTGDSSGEFADSTWEIWAEELNQASQWLAEKSHPTHIVSVRAGSLFANSLVEKAPDRYSKICMVEPFILGTDVANDFLQLRVARSLFEGTKESLTQLTEQLKNGSRIDVGGYEFSPKLYESMCRSDIRELYATYSVPGLIVGCGRSPDSKRNVRAKDLVQGWVATGSPVEYRFIQTEPFWSQELPNPALTAIKSIVSFLVGDG